MLDPKCYKCLKTVHHLQSNGEKKLICFLLIFKPKIKETKLNLFYITIHQINCNNNKQINLFRVASLLAPTAATRVKKSGERFCLEIVPVGHFLLRQ